MKKIFIVIITTLVGISVNSQAILNLEKYWIYRERLKNYYLQRSQQGGGIIATNRYVNGIEYNDPAWNLSYWISTLAMEYKLLNDNGYSTQQTLLDLYYAIESINRVDIAAESNMGWSCGFSGSTQPNGFLITDDIPGEFFDNNFNGNLNADYLNESKVPPVDGDRIACVKSAVNYYEKPREYSQDHWGALFFGFAFVKKYIPVNLQANSTFSDGETKYVKEVQNISYRFIDHLIDNNLTYTNLCENRCVHGVCNPLNQFFCGTLQPDGNCNGNDCGRGGALVNFAMIGFLEANKFIQGINDYPALSVYNLTLQSLLFNPVTRIGWNLGLPSFGLLSNIDGGKFIPFLACAANIWNYTKIGPAILGSSKKRVAERLTYIGIHHNMQHLILSHRLLYGNSYETFGELITIDNDYYECLLDAAPCRGFDGYDINGENFEWGHKDRLNGDRYSIVNGPTSHNAFPKVDYLFYFNLYNLINPNYLGSNYAPINIHQLALENITKENYTEYDVKNFEASNTITAGNNYHVSIQSVFGGNKGRVTFAAGKKIDLLPGFDAKYGSFLNASIDPTIGKMNCAEPTQTDCSHLNYRSILDDTTFNALDYDTIYIDTSEINNPKISVIQNNQESTTELDYKVYPNPNNGDFTFFINNSEAIKYIYLTDLLGKNLATFAVQDKSININVNYLSQGIYILSFTIYDKLCYIKIVIQ